MASAHPLSHLFLKTSKNRSLRKLKLELLEGRRVLAASGTVFPAITGTIFQDTNNDGAPSAGEGIESAIVRLFLDDGDGVYETNGEDVQVGSDATTDADGVYCFDNLDDTSSYFVVQIAQTVNGIPLQEEVSTLISPGTPGVLIDDFSATQAEAVAIPPAPSSGASTVATTTVLGGERDVRAFLDSGQGEVSVNVNQFGSSPTLRYDADVGVLGRGAVVWDGVDTDAATLSFGLNGTDLTSNGENTGIMLRIGSRDVDATATVRIYKTDATTSSEATVAIPVTTSGAAEEYVFLPFASFVGSASPSDVDAIELIIDSSATFANNVELDMIGANGPKIFNFEYIPTVDLEISKTDNQETAVPGEQLTYTVTARNNGPIDVTGATISDPFPPELTNASFTSAANNGATGNTPSGNTDINDTVDLPVDSSVVYTVTGTVDPSATGTVENTASIAAPAGITEIDSSNNSATDIDTLEPQVDLAVTKTDSLSSVTPGDTVTYTIIVTNNGPSDVFGAVIDDAVPTELSNVSFSSTATGDAIGNTSSGTGNINDVVNMPVGSTITYTLSGIVVSSATGELRNTASVTAPNGTLELDISNNSAEDVDTIVPLFDLEVSKTDNVTEVEPGDSVTYDIVVRNNGPSDVANATVTDTFPDELINVTYTSSTTGIASGNTASGTGNINDTLSLANGAEVIYSATATVSDDAIGTIDNSVTVTAEDPTNETDTTNNTALDQDTVIPVFDLVISKTDNVTEVTPGQTLTYLIDVQNTGPSDVTGATVSDPVPAQLTNVVYTSTASGGATGNTNGTGSLADTVDLPAGSSVSYQFSGTVASDASGNLTNTATVAAPNDVAEEDTSNNAATDVDTINRLVDLTISKTDNQSTITVGDTTTYEIVVTNEGPTDVVGALITDSFPATLSGVSYTSTTSGGASGNTLSGLGDINDIVNLPVNSSITYLATGTVQSSSIDTISNTASVTAPSDVIETDASNNTATDVDAIDIALRSISGFVYVDLNGDGEKDGLEPPIEGVLINLEGIDNLGNTVIRSTTTDPAGAYEFSDLQPGTYTIRESQPFGFGDGAESVGTGQAVDPAVADDVFSNIGLGPDADATNFNFGEARQQGTKRRLLASSFV